MQLAVLNSSIVITRVFVHVSIVNYLLRGGGFFRELHTEAMQSRKFSRE